MHIVTLMTLALVTQAPQASMQLKNTTRDQHIGVNIRCRDHANCPSNQQRVLRPGQKGSFKVHPGNFQVFARNQEQQTARSNRILVADERDRMLLAAMVSGRRRVLKFDIVEDDD